MNEKLRLFIDKLFPPEKKLLNDLTKATKRDKLIWHQSMRPEIDRFTDIKLFAGEYKYHIFDVRFQYLSIGSFTVEYLGGLKWRRAFVYPGNANDTISFNAFDNGLYTAIMDQQGRLQRQKELPNYNRNASIRDILSRVGD